MKRINKQAIIIYSLLVIYLLFVKVISNFAFTKSFIYYINPLIWLGLFVITLLFSRGTKDRIMFKKDKNKTIIIILIFYFMVYFVSGLIFGYANNVFARDLVSVIINIESFVVIVIFEEYIRWFLVQHVGSKKIYFVVITILFILIELSTFNFGTIFIDNEAIFKFVGAVLLPMICTNMLLTYLVSSNGFISSILYRGSFSLVPLLLPIIPKMDWFLKGISEMILPLVVFLAINYEQEVKIKRVTRKGKQKQNPIKYIPLVFIMLVFVLFIAGVFKYSPIAVMSNSMYPYFQRGDLLVVKKITEQEKKDLKVGQVIQYKYKNILVMHRIKEINKKNNKISIITKGDHNNAPDKPVSLDQVLGIGVWIIPKVGYPSVWFSELLHGVAKNIEIET